MSSATASWPDGSPASRGRAIAAAGIARVTFLLRRDGQGLRVVLSRNHQDLRGVLSSA
jgi:hypothetical protein